jgi:hypothetical protein
MTSAMLLEYEDNNIGEDKVCKRSKWGFKNKVTSKNLTVLGRFMFQRAILGIGPPFYPHIYAGTMRLCKWIKAYGQGRVSTH